MNYSVTWLYRGLPEEGKAKLWEDLSSFQWRLGWEDLLCLVMTGDIWIVTDPPPRYRLFDTGDPRYRWPPLVRLRLVLRRATPRIVGKIVDEWRPREWEADPPDPGRYRLIEVAAEGDDVSVEKVTPKPEPPPEPLPPAISELPGANWLDQGAIIRRAGRQMKKARMEAYQREYARWQEEYDEWWRRKRKNSR